MGFLRTCFINVSGMFIHKGSTSFSSIRTSVQKQWKRCRHILKSGSRVRGLLLADCLWLQRPRARGGDAAFHLLFTFTKASAHAGKTYTNNKKAARKSVRYQNDRRRPPLPFRLKWSDPDGPAESRMK